ncbi:hypothetical protein OB955_24980 [Halobacteria archaeon AArc-m2/3/4]|uniref:Uncharacterized protein n=1 Tax=Natronoglomus mannanivorans TaxID=2979990 RepID=A0ABT2QLW7_9EURY|nr:hypothetical protein [Halobacteria archaeon AArc-m2/3/4]
MVDAGDYVSRGGIRATALVTTLVSSLVYAMWDGFIGFLTALWSVPADIVSAGLASAQIVAVSLFEQPTHTVRLAWNEAARSLPDVGPLTFVVGVVVLVAVFRLQAEILAHIREVWFDG